MIIVSNTSNAGAGSLRQAIADATPGEEITFSVTGTILLNSGELLISQALIITGPGSGSLTVSGAGTFRVFNTDTGVISISGLTIASGAAAEGAGIHNEATLTLNDVIVTTCTSSDDGGGIWNSSTITMTDCAVQDSTASAGDGGGIYNSGTITANDCPVTGCSSTGNGGGIWNSGTFTHNGGSVSDNTSNPGIGAGVYNEGTYTPTEVSIASNTATGDGAGIHNELGTVTVTRCTINANDPIGISNSSGTVTVNNSTISGNTNSGIVSETGSTDILHSTIVLNIYGVSQTSGSVLTLFNTILAGNSFDYDGETADVVSNGGNILGINSNPITPGPGDQSVLTYLGLVMGALYDNGGPTLTHALLDGSPAIDAGDNTGAPATDQRGEPRVVDGTIDVGAFESDIEPPPEPPPDPDPEPEPEPEPEEPTGITPSERDCRRVSCCNVNGVEFSPFVYSLVNGETYLNDEMTFTIPCPPGYDCSSDSVQIVIPPGTIKFTPTDIDPNPPTSGDPWNAAAGVYTFNCGGETLTIRTAGLGFTSAQITQIINFLAECYANQKAWEELGPTPIVTPSGQPGLRLWNTEQSCTVECPDGESGDPVTVTIPANTNSTIIAASSTPMERYLAQQALNTAAYDAACSQAQSELSCAGPECPSLLAAIPIGGGVCIQGAYDPVNNWLFFTNLTNSTVIKIDPVTNTVLGTAVFPDNTAGIVYVPGPTTLSAEPALLVVTDDGSIHHLDPTTLAITLLTALTSTSNSPMVYAATSDKVFIPISQPTGGMDVYTVSTGILVHIVGTTIPQGLAYNSDLDEVYSSNFDTATYPGVDVLGLDAATNAVIKQYTMSEPSTVPGQNSIAYALSTGKLYIGGRRASDESNFMFVVSAGSFTEEAVITLPTTENNVVPTVHHNPDLNIILAGLSANTLATNSIEVYNPNDNTLLCSLTGLNTVGRGAVAEGNDSLYIQIRSAADDLEIGQLGPTP